MRLCVLDQSHFHKKMWSQGRESWKDPYNKTPLYICFSNTWIPERKWIPSSLPYIRFNHDALGHKPPVASQISTSVSSSWLCLNLKLGWSTALQVSDLAHWGNPEGLDDAIKKWVGISSPWGQPWPVQNKRWEGAGQMNSPSMLSFMGCSEVHIPPWSPFGEVPCAHDCWMTCWLSSWVTCGSGGGRGGSKVHYIAIYCSWLIFFFPLLLWACIS